MPRQPGQSPYLAVQRAALRSAARVWHDLRIKDLHRSARQFELMHRALGFAALALLTVIPLLSRNINSVLQGSSVGSDMARSFHWTS